MPAETSWYRKREFIKGRCQFFKIQTKLREGWAEGCRLGGGKWKAFFFFFSPLHWNIWLLLNKYNEWHLPEINFSSIWVQDAAHRTVSERLTALLRAISLQDVWAETVLHYLHYSKGTYCSVSLRKYGAGSLLIKQLGLFLGRLTAAWWTRHSTGVWQGSLSPGRGRPAVCQQGLPPWTCHLAPESPQWKSICSGEKECREERHSSSWKFTGDRRPAGGHPFFFPKFCTRIQNGKQATLAWGENK